MTADCRKIIEKSIAAVSPESAILSHCRRIGNLLQIGQDDDNDAAQVQEYDLTNYEQLLVIAFGKASSGMATALVRVLVGNDDDDNNYDDSEIMPNKKISGLVIVKDGHASDAEIAFLAKHNIAVQEASHPVPDYRAVQATQDILAMVEDAASHPDKNKTLVLVCISGGGSALFCAPHPGLSLEDIQQTNRVLLQSGLSIHEMNVIRKKLEIAKGGGLLSRAAGTTLVSLILSDVLGDPLDLIASGPTVPDTSTWQEACELVERNRLHDKGLPTVVWQFLQDGRRDEKKRPNHSNNALLLFGQTCLVGNNILAVKCAAEMAQQLGYHPIVLGTEFRGEAKDVANNLVAMAQQIQQQNPLLQKYLMTTRTTSLPVALIAGGETTVTLPLLVSGKGGRNQELALAAALALQRQISSGFKSPLRNIVIASVGTDGTDGPTDAAGAIIDGGTPVRLLAGKNGNPLHQAMQALQQHDAYHYFDQYDGEGNSPLIRTGPTGTNVADIMIVLIDREEQ